MIKNAEAVLRQHGIAKLSDPEYRHLRFPRYMEYDERTSELVKMLCRLCGTQIAGWMDDDVVEQHTNRTDPTHVVTKLIVKRRFARFPSARTVRFLMSNEALYEPVMCGGCASHVTLEIARELYVSDLVEMVAEVMVRGQALDRALKTIEDMCELQVICGQAAEV